MVFNYGSIFLLLFLLDLFLPFLFTAMLCILENTLHIFFRKPERYGYSPPCYTECMSIATKNIVVLTFAWCALLCFILSRTRHTNQFHYSFAHSFAFLIALEAVWKACYSDIGCQKSTFCLGRRMQEQRFLPPKQAFCHQNKLFATKTSFLPPK